MSVFRFDKAISIARGVKVFLTSVFGATPDGPLNTRRREDRAESPENAQQRRTSEQRKRIESKRREISRLQDELSTAKRAPKEGAEGVKHKKKRLMREKQELLWLRNGLRGTKARAESSLSSQLASQAAGEPETGALPDFVIIGAQKCGTSSFYRLLCQHSHVEWAAAKELHYFDRYFDESIEWYRRCFPTPRWKDGRKTITGEASPSYLFDPPVPRRMAEIIPQARLIVLLRNPVDRAYSHYHHQVRNSGETRSFEELVEAEVARLRLQWNKVLEEEHHWDYRRNSSYLARGIYVDQLLRWSKFYSGEQMLVLKSEDFFERPQETLKVVLGYLDLPAWEPEAREIRNNNKGHYEQEMDPVTRRRLEEFFEPHNQRLYEYLGVDLGW